MNLENFENLLENVENLTIHFVGIKGTGMTALVEILNAAGAKITGSDVSERFYTDAVLEKLNIQVFTFSEKNISENIDLIIYSSAYKLDVNPDLIEAQKKNIPCLLYTQALGLYSKIMYSLGICGVHGKTSTTGLTGSILKELPLPSQILAGSVINSFGNSCTYSTEKFKEQKASINSVFVAETCEYQRHFMSFHPKKIVLTSVESDHQDYYPTYESIRDAFIDYALLLPLNEDLIYCSDDEGAKEVADIVKTKREDINLIPYGFNSCGDFKIELLDIKNDYQEFKIKFFGDFIFKLAVPGLHEVLDACAGIALSCQVLKKFNLNPLNYKNEILNGLISFTGGKRRSEIISKINLSNGNNLIIMDDYGHHPTAIKTTLEGYKKFYSKRKIIVDFMSHTYSRTEGLLDEFASSFESAHTVILHKIYSSARENINDFKINGRTLFEQTCKYHNDVHYFEEILDAKDFLLEELNKPLTEEFSDGYLFVTMGAGDNWKLGKAIQEILE